MVSHFPVYMFIFEQNFFMKLVFASHNIHKIKEIRALLPGFIELLSLSDIGCYEEIPETADTIEGNAQLKAAHVVQHYGYDCFADDTGLEVDSLNGAPGVYSARYAGEDKKDTENIQKLLRELRGKDNREARFKTVIALYLNGQTQLFTGLCEGEISTKPTGAGGFGYDPVFKPQGFEQSFAEMDASQKNEISHRGRALEKLIVYLRSLTLNP